MAPAPVASSACSSARHTATPPRMAAAAAAPRTLPAAAASAVVCRSHAAAAASTSSSPPPPLGSSGAARAAAAAAASRRPSRPSPRAAAAAAVVAAALTTATDVAPSSLAPAPSCRLVKDVVVDVQRTSITSRVLVAAVDIAAPPSAVWGALTDYERLAEFIPSLERNECLARDASNGTARLRQVGAQDVAMGVKFRAAVTLDIREHTGPGGISADLITSSHDSRDYLGKGARFPAPLRAGSVDGDDDNDDEDGGDREALVRATQAMDAAGAVPAALSTLMSVDEDDLAAGGGLGLGLPPGFFSGGGAAADGGAPAASPAPVIRTRRGWPRDISFELVEGDFNAFRGVWRVSEGPAGPLTARLAYSVFVQPQAFLPVGLIQGRISRDVATNLKSVRAHAEEVVFAKILRQQREKEQQAQALAQAQEAVV